MSDSLTLHLSGKVDSANADATEKELRASIGTDPVRELTLDLENLSYISSAGLRVVLRLRKDYPSLKLINASSEVYDILDMTGFTEMLTVTKAYRRLSVEGCEVIGQGANGKVYRLDPDTIIKVYMNPDSLPDIQKERELARKAFVMGVPTAIPYDVVRVGDGYGSVFELLSAKSLAKLLIADPSSLEDCVRISVDLLKKIHETELKPGDIPDEKTIVLGWVQYLEPHLPADVHARLLALVEAVPEDHHMMHGDYHIKNVMVQNGESLLIDMDTLCMGHPIFEFASIYLAYQGFGVLDHDNIPRFLGIPYETADRFMRRTFELYFDTTDPAVIERLLDKAKVVGYTRLMRRTIRRGADSEPARSIVAFCKEQLTDLVSRVDTLTF